MSELAREALPQYQQHDRIRKDALAALAELQQEAARRGLDKITMDEIDAEIAASRRERRQDT